MGKEQRKVGVGHVNASGLTVEKLPPRAWSEKWPPMDWSASSCYLEISSRGWSVSYVISKNCKGVATMDPGVQAAEN